MRRALKSSAVSSECLRWQGGGVKELCRRYEKRRGNTFVARASLIKRRARLYIECSREKRVEREGKEREEERSRGREVERERERENGM